MDKSGEPEERSRMVLAWAKKCRARAFCPPSDEYVSLAGDLIGDPASDGHFRENERLARLMAR